MFMCLQKMCSGQKQQVHFDRVQQRDVVGAMLSVIVAITSPGRAFTLVAPGGVTTIMWEVLCICFSGQINATYLHESETKAADGKGQTVS